MAEIVETHPVRSWLGIPYATAERFRSPTLVPFNPDRQGRDTRPGPSSGSRTPSGVFQTSPSNCDLLPSGCHGTPQHPCALVAHRSAEVR
jgi:hypothetical protein